MADLYKKEVRGDQCLVEIYYLDESSVIDMTKADRRVSRFSKILSVGPEVKELKVGDDILIPEKEDGRVLFPLDGKQYAIFPESGVRIVRKKLL